MNKLSYFLLALSLFGCASSSAPFILDPYPADNAVVRDSTVVIKFRVAEPIDIHSFNEESLDLFGSRTGALTARVRYAEEKQEIEMAIVDPLRFFERITVAITDLALLKNGNRTLLSTTWDFWVIPPNREIDSGFVDIGELDILPEPIGGMAEVQRNVIYPIEARDAGIQGMVFVEAFLDEKGRVIEAIVHRGIGSGCDEAAVEAVRKTRFTPGIHKGIPVKSKTRIPIRFRVTR